MALDHVGNPGEAVPLFLAGRGDVAGMHEPVSTAALLKAGPESIPLVRALGITEVCGTHNGRGPRLGGAAGFLLCDAPASALIARSRKALRRVLAEMLARAGLTSV